jgi:ubiquinone/menaquinone biosynthesis C-methylase UbiE
MHPARAPALGPGDPFLETEAYETEAGRAFLDRRDASLLERLGGMGLARGKVLVLGAGTGRLIVKIADRFRNCEVTGLDCCAAALEEGLEKARLSGLVGRLWLVKGDACQADFPDNSFDALVCDDLLHHVPAPEKLFDEAGRVTRDDGLILMRDLARPPLPCWAWLRRARGLECPPPMRENRSRCALTAYTKGELKELSARTRLRSADIFLDRDGDLILARG